MFSRIKEIGTKQYIMRTLPLFKITPANGKLLLPAAYAPIVSTTELIDSMNDIAKRLTVIFPNPIPPSKVSLPMWPANVRLRISKN